MKDKFLIVGVFFLLMASLPLLLTGHLSETATADSAAKDSSDAAYVRHAAALCTEAFSDEAIRAVAIILKSNKAAGEPAPQTEQADLSPSLVKRVQTIYNSNKEILVYRDKPVAVPVSACSNGSTAATESPYLCAAASPWDAFDSAYDAEEACAGVSANGLRRLCERGFSAEEALQWFLPQVQVSAAVTPQRPAA